MFGGYSQPQSDNAGEKIMGAGILFSILVLVAAVGLILVITFFSARWIWRRGRIGQFTLGLAALGFAWGVYDAIYPSESFYISQLAGLAGVRLPGNVAFVEKTTSFPDIHGDYSACFIVRLSATEMTAFRAEVNTGVQTTESGVAQAFRCDSAAPALSTASTVLHIDLSQRVTRPDAAITAQVDERNSIVKIEWHLW